MSYTSPLVFGVSAAAGYLIGVRAGQSGVERLVAISRGLADDVGLQSAAGAISGRAAELLTGARRRLG